MHIIDIIYIIALFHGFCTIFFRKTWVLRIVIDKKTTTILYSNQSLLCIKL